MARILDPIPAQSFELIRNRILEILIEEIVNQLQITYDDPDSINFFLEKAMPIDHVDLPCINVCFDGGDFQNKNVKSGEGGYNYMIACHAKADAQDNYEEYEGADTIASLRVQSLLGKCKMILENPDYRTLGFSPGFIARVTVQSIKMGVQDKNDAHTTAMGFIMVNVVSSDLNEVNIPNNIAGYETRITIDSSTKGYKYSSD